MTFENKGLILSSMTNKKSPIEELFSDTGPVDVEEAVKILKPLIQVQRESNEIHLTEAGNKETGINKILTYALGKKILKLEKITESENFSAKEVSEKLGLKKGSVDYYFNSLRGHGLILGSGSRYSIPNAKVSEILNRLRGKKGR